MSRELSEPEETPTERPHFDSTKQINVSLESIINNMDLTNEQKEKLYRDFINVPLDKGAVVWENNKIAGFKLYSTFKCVHMTISIDKDGITCS